MKKTVGLILIAAGLAFLMFIVYTWYQDKNKIISPIPEREGVKVIHVTPQK